MSRIGKKPVALLDGVTVDVSGRTVNVNGPKGKLSWEFPFGIEVAVNSGEVQVSRTTDSRRFRELHGLTRSLINGMVTGVHSGYKKKLEIYGAGYGCNVKGQNLELNLGFMGRSVNKGPQFIIPIPTGIQVDIETPAARGNTEPARMSVSGIDKQAVGQFAAEIRQLRKPEPYQGKGVRYSDETVRRKQGKALASGG
jgi:large subunit ribosomal protein L6